MPCPLPSPSEPIAPFPVRKTLATPLLSFAIRLLLTRHFQVGFSTDDDSSSVQTEGAAENGTGEQSGTARSGGLAQPPKFIGTRALSENDAFDEDDEEEDEDLEDESEYESEIDELAEVVEQVRENWARRN